jgi:hypothetical protein
MINGRCLARIYLLILLVLGLTFGFGSCIAYILWELFVTYSNYINKTINYSKKKFQVLILKLFL